MPRQTESYLRRTTPAALAAFLLVGSIAQADIVYQATGVVTNVSDQISSIQAGDAYQVTVTVDDSVSDSFSLDPDAGRYNNSIISYSFDIGNGVYAASANSLPADNQVEVYDNFFSGADSLFAGLNGADGSLAGLSTLDGFNVSTFQLFSVSDSTGSALSSDTMPGSLPSFSAWDYSLWSLNLTDGTFGYAIQGTLTSLTVVPAPGSIAILALSGLIAQKRRR